MEPGRTPWNKNQGDAHWDNLPGQADQHKYLQQIRALLEDKKHKDTVREVLAWILDNNCKKILNNFNKQYGDPKIVAKKTLAESEDDAPSGAEKGGKASSKSGKKGKPEKSSPKASELKANPDGFATSNSDDFDDSRPLDLNDIAGPAFPSEDSTSSEEAEKFDHALLEVIKQEGELTHERLKGIVQDEAKRNALFSRLRQIRQEDRLGAIAYLKTRPYLKDEFNVWLKDQKDHSDADGSSPYYKARLDALGKLAMNHVTPMNRKTGSVLSKKECTQLRATKMFEGKKYKEPVLTLAIDNRLRPDLICKGMETFYFKRMSQTEKKLLVKILYHAGVDCIKEIRRKQNIKDDKNFITALIAYAKVEDKDTYSDVENALKRSK